MSRTLEKSCRRAHTLAHDSLAEQRRRTQIVDANQRRHLQELRHQYGHDNIFFLGACAWAEEEGLQSLLVFKGLEFYGEGVLRDSDGNRYLRILDPSGLRFYAHLREPS